MKSKKENGRFDKLEICNDVMSSANVLAKTGELTVGIFHSCFISGDAVCGISLEPDCLLEVSFACPLPWHDALNLVEWLSKFFTLCMGVQAEIESLKFHFQGQDSPVNLHFCRLRSREITKSDIRRMPFPYSSLQVCVGSILESWINAPDDLAEALGMLISLLTYDWRMPVDLVLTATSQLIELVSKHGTETYSESEEDHSKHVRAVKEAVSGLDPKTVHWIMSRIGSNNKGQSRLLRELLENYKEYADWLLPNSRRYRKTQSAVRNHFSHRGDGGRSMSPLECHEHSLITLLLVYGIVWQKLGLSSKVVIQRLEKSGFMRHVVENARRIYA